MKQNINMKKGDWEKKVQIPKADVIAKKRFEKKHEENAAIAKEEPLSNAVQITIAEKKVFDAFKSENMAAVVAAMHEYNSIVGDENYNGVILRLKDMDLVGSIKHLKQKKGRLALAD